MLTGEHPQMKSGRRFWARVPARERCKMCNAPYTGVGGMVSQLRGRGPSNWHPRICHACETFSKGHPGGVEIELSMAFVDVRNSTELSGGMSPSEYATTMNRFYTVATNALTDSDAIIDKLVGDEVMALFLPGFAGDDHASKAVNGALAIMERVGYGTSPGPFISIGAGVNTGTAYVGVVGDKGNYKDFTALGEPVNLASRLAQAAGSGEVLVSQATVRLAGLQPVELRSVTAKGFAEPVQVGVLQA
jgi:adenylate cyclase